jgi:energy-coupling factor transporter ATP-binding protein EcfA2
MKKMKITSVKLSYYKQFVNERIDLGNNLNLIIGENGTGKTTLFNALQESIDSNIKGVEILAEDITPIETKSLMFINSSIEADLTPYRDYAEKKSIPKEKLNANVAKIYKDLSGNIFNENDPLKKLSPGERLLITYSYVFAIKKILGLSIPLIVNGPITPLDKEQTQVLFKYLTRSKEQIILFMLPSDGERITMPEKERKPKNFLLEHNAKTKTTRIIEKR